MFSSIRAYIQTCTQLSEDEFLFFERRLKHKKIPKKTFLLQQGEVCNFEGFIIKGCIKTYFIDNNGFEVILTFATENWWVSDMMSFSEQKPSKMFIETLEGTELLMLTLTKKEAALQKFLLWNVCSA
ncbi:MAG: Crp/Fnr family transcriptional regulator [Sphingobacteriales bacterium]|nr:Crp/Fnr family transcriptional regulator [Sphingobacteriales bacterium]